MTASYQIVEKESKHSSRELAAFLAKEGQLLLPVKKGSELFLENRSDALHPL
jgi:hypothetical protein